MSEQGTAVAALIDTAQRFTADEGWILPLDTKSRFRPPPPKESE